MFGSYSLMANVKANALAVLAAILNLPADTNYHLTVATHHLFCPKYDLEVSEVHTTSTNIEPRDWRFPIIDYVLHDILLDDPREMVCSTKVYSILLRCTGKNAIPLFI